MPNHPNIVQIHGLVTSAGIHALVMDCGYCHKHDGRIDVPSPWRTEGGGRAR